MYINSSIFANFLNFKRIYHLVLLRRAPAISKKSNIYYIRNIYIGNFHFLHFN